MKISITLPAHICAVTASAPAPTPAAAAAPADAPASGSDPPGPEFLFAASSKQPSY